MQRKLFTNTLTVLKYLAIYYLSAKMICFAIPKILFMQFRIPNYSTYITLAEMSKYQHMWSFFGRSYNYNLFIGGMEFLIGALVLFKRTRLIALLISLGVCLNILILNIEFEILFATQHILLDLGITLILLIEYRKDILKFFITLGGKMEGVAKSSEYKFFRLFPYVFLAIVSIGYFIFSLYIKEVYIGDPNIIGAYKIEKIQINDSTLTPSPGRYGKHPMLFLENSNQFVLSVEDTLYVGAYTIEDKKINFGLESYTKFGLKSFIGDFENNILKGKDDEDKPLEIFVERIPEEENYLNGLYK